MFWKYSLCFVLVFADTPWAACFDRVLPLLFRSDIKNILLGLDGVHPRRKYRGQEGYAKFVRRHIPSGNMQQGFMEASAALNGPTFKILYWRQFPGDLDEFQETTRILLENGSIRPEYRRKDGYIRFAREWPIRVQGKQPGEIPDSDINLQEIYRRAYAVVDYPIFHLNWPMYPGSIDEFERTKEMLLDGWDKYMGKDGYIRFAREWLMRIQGKQLEEIHNSDIDLDATYLRISAILYEEPIFKNLGWSHFPGTLAELERTEEMLLNAGDRYKGIKGYILFAREWVRQIQGKSTEEIPDSDIDLREAYKRAFAVLDQPTFEGLGWPHFPGTLARLKRAREILLYSHSFTGGKDKIRHEYAGTDGFILFARESQIPEGIRVEEVPDEAIDMQKAYWEGSAALGKDGKDAFEEMRWGEVFSSNLAELKAIRARNLSEADPIFYFLGWGRW